MKVIGINGSPRKKWNTAMLLAKALEGAASQGAETDSFHLYDLNYKGCVSCFACNWAIWILPEPLIPSTKASVLIAATWALTEPDNLRASKFFSLRL